MADPQAPETMQRMINLYQQKLADEELTNIQLTVQLEEAVQRLNEQKEVMAGTATDLRQLRKEIEELKGTDAPAEEVVETPAKPVRKRA